LEIRGAYTLKVLSEDPVAMSVPIGFQAIDRRLGRKSDKDIHTLRSQEREKRQHEDGTYFGAITSITSLASLLGERSGGLLRRFFGFFLGILKLLVLAKCDGKVPKAKVFTGQQRACHKENAGKEGVRDGKSRTNL
jgi:hypothetical protein